MNEQHVTGALPKYHRTGGGTLFTVAARARTLLAPGILATASAAFWGLDTWGRLGSHDERIDLAAAMTCTIATTVLGGFRMVLRRHERTTLLVLGALAGQVTRQPGGGAPTGPFPRLAEVPRQDAA